MTRPQPDACPILYAAMRSPFSDARFRQSLVEYSGPFPAYAPKQCRFAPGFFLPRWSAEYAEGFSFLLGLVRHIGILPRMYESFFS